ncbi:LuxR family transcriptional regulator [Paenibacillus pinisoli]|uniref:LuxR family transcriptional regulator n=1 Tax=Paenibacillus pinisoli TaxID=1276110 RepID=A0A3A6PFF9_9BACL|nr:DMT family transporter [Paenibacillus pinisoli]RJX38930.1 LuxR family transcriptional regulator [Paenibacillus pinisoli]
MAGLAFALVLGSGFVHSIWNLYTKKSMNKIVFLWICQIIAVIVLMPWTIAEWDAFHFTGTALLIMLVSVVLHGMYVLLLAAAYTVGDLSQVYPIMRGTSPLLVPFLAVLFLDESLSPMGWAGVAAIVAGILFLSEIKLKRSSSTKAPLLAFAVGLCIAGYIVVDKMALDYFPAVIVLQATNVGNVLVLTWAALRSRAIGQELRVNWKTMLLGGVLAPGGYLLFMFAVSLAPVAQLAPMREIGTVFGTLLGIFILKEQQGPRRIMTSILITAGIIVLGLWG